MKQPVTACVLLATLAALAPAASAKDFEQVAGKAADGTRFYEDSVEVDAPASQLWRAFTDQASYRAWAAPVSAIDFRIGGVIEASYDDHGQLGSPQNIKNAIIAYVPERLLVFRNVQAPDGLPGKEVYSQTVKTLEFVTIAPGRTKVIVSGVGFASGAAFDRLYDFFSAGDGAMLVGLKHSYERPAH